MIPGSLSDDAYRRARLGDVDLFTSVAILTELASKLRDKFDWNEDRIRAALKSISRTAHVVKTTPHLSIVSDATDNRILECAEKVDADLIVTGDPHHVAREYIGLRCQRGQSSSPAPSFQQPVHALPHPRSRLLTVDAFREERIVVRFGVP